MINQMSVAKSLSVSNKKNTGGGPVNAFNKKGEACETFNKIIR